MTYQTHSALKFHDLFLLFNLSIVSDSLWLLRWQHTRLPCPLPSPGLLLKLMFIDLVMSCHLILCHPLLLLPSIFPSIRVFSNELALRIRWPKYWSFSISLSSEYSGLISFRILQARILEWVAIPFPRRSSWPRDQTQISCIAGRFSTIWATDASAYVDILIGVKEGIYLYI